MEAHDDNLRGAIVDGWLATYLRSVLEQDPNSIVVFMSDHDRTGNRPFMDILLPVEFARRHRLEDVGRYNQDRPIVSLDLHRTLKELTPGIVSEKCMHGVHGTRADAAPVHLESRAGGSPRCVS